MIITYLAGNELVIAEATSIRMRIDCISIDLADGTETLHWHDSWSPKQVGAFLGEYSGLPAIPIARLQIDRASTYPDSPENVEDLLRMFGVYR